MRRRSKSQFYRRFEGIYGDQKISTRIGISCSKLWVHLVGSVTAWTSIFEIIHNSKNNSMLTWKQSKRKNQNQNNRLVPIVKDRIQTDTSFSPTFELKHWTSLIVSNQSLLSSNWSVSRSIWVSRRHACHLKYQRTVYTSPLITFSFNLRFLSLKSISFSPSFAIFISSK